MSSYPALYKCPGIRLIGIGEDLRRIMGKAVMLILRPDVLKSTGYQQMCAGQDAGCEVAIHVVRDLYDLARTDLYKLTPVMLLTSSIL